MPGNGSWTQHSVAAAHNAGWKGDARYLMDPNKPFASQAYTSLLPLQSGRPSGGGGGDGGTLLLTYNKYSCCEFTATI